MISDTRWWTLITAFAERGSPMYLVGYMPAQNRVYVADKDMNIYAFALSLSYIEYQSAALRGDLETADEILPSVPVDMRNKLARFLDAHGEQADQLLALGQSIVAITDFPVVICPFTLASRFTHRPQTASFATHNRCRSQIRSCRYAQ